jgi:hypothetical protein
VLRPQVLLNGQDVTSNYDIIAIDLPQSGEYIPFLIDLNPLIKESGFDGSDFYEVARTSIAVPRSWVTARICSRKPGSRHRRETTEDVLAAAKKLHGSQEGLSGVCWNAASPQQQTGRRWHGEQRRRRWQVGEVKPGSWRTKVHRSAAASRAATAGTIVPAMPDVAVRLGCVGMIRLRQMANSTVCESIKTTI